jgi:hypothetical protein
VLQAAYLAAARDSTDSPLLHAALEIQRVGHR